MLSSSYIRRRIALHRRLNLLHVRSSQVASIALDDVGQHSPITSADDQSEETGKTESLVINIADTENQHVYFSPLEDFLQFVDYRSFGRSKCIPNCLKKIIFCIQKIFWPLIFVLAILDSLMELKVPLWQIKQTKGNEIESTAIGCGQVFLQLLHACMFLHMLVWKGDDAFKPLLDLLKEAPFRRNRRISRCITVAPKTLFTVSVCLSILYTIFGFDEVYINRHWYFKGLALLHYQDAYESFFEWGSEENIAYENEFSAKVVALSIVGFATDFGSTFTYLFLGDLFLVVALTLKMEIDEIDHLRKRFANEIDMDNLKILGEDIMENYKFLMKVSTQINDIFGAMITLLHFINVFLCVSFLDNIFNQPDLGLAMLRITGVVKCIFTYYICVTSTEKIQSLRAWYRDERTRSVLDTDVHTSRFCAVLDELKSNPIGIGSGEFYVNRQFARKLMGLMVTYFFIIAKSSTQESASTRTAQQDTGN